ncbi:MAG: TVP38/TMEM64 family protein [Candidatus Omnitrophica bacterium]|nr:TVP38/TMEM64 family protein [Candidatus Omnitrophota bacterium]
MAKKKFLKSGWFKIILLIVILAAVFMILRALGVDFSNVSEEKFKSWVESLGFWGPIAYVIIYIIRPLILFPAAVLSATAGIIWGAGPGFIILLIAANLSATAEFFLARYAARGLVEKHLGERAEKIDKKIKKHGFLTVLLIRIIPNVAWDIQNLSLGLTRVKFRDYFLATFLGIMPGSFALVFFGSSFIKVIYNPKNFWILGVAILIFAGVILLKKKLRKKHADKVYKK